MRPSQMKKGGGFLDNINSVWEDYQFTDEFNGQPFEPGKIPSYDGKGKIDKPHTLNLFLTFRADMAEEPTTTTIKMANEFDLFAISDDGHVLSMADGSPLDLNQNTAGGKLLRSLEAAGFPVDDLDDDADTLDLTPCLNKRYRTVQRVDEERTKKYGLKVDKKTKKGYERKDLIFDQYYGDGDEAPVKAASKPNGKIATPVAKPVVKAKVATKGPSLEDLAKETLVGILQANGGTLPSSKLSVKVLTAMGKHEKREDVRKLCFSPDFLGAEDMPWTYDKAKKTVTLTAEEESE